MSYGGYNAQQNPYAQGGQNPYEQGESFSLCLRVGIVILTSIANANSIATNIPKTCCVAYRMAD
jgi:hypothetical protein